MSLRGSWRLNDAAQIGWAAWTKFAEAPELLVNALRDSLGGRNLMAIGMGRDIAAAAEIDRFEIVPSFDPASGRITLDAGASAH
jgi:hypothetical protein